MEVEDEVIVTGERSREERDAEGRRRAISLLFPAEEKALLRQRMEELAAELAIRKRSVMGTAVPLPPIGSLFQVEVTALQRTGVFVAGEFGSGFLHASEYSRGVIQLHRGGGAEFEASYALFGSDRGVGIIRPAANVMDASALLQSVLPVGKRVWAEVTSTEGGQIYLSTKNVDQHWGRRRPALPVSPALGQEVVCVVAHVNGTPGQHSWAICKLPEYADALTGMAVEAFLPASRQHLGGYALGVGDVLHAHVAELPPLPPPPDDEAAESPPPPQRLVLSAGVDHAQELREHRAAKRQAKAERRRVRKTQQQQQAKQKKGKKQGATLQSAIAKKKGRGGNKGQHASAAAAAIARAPWPAFRGADAGFGFDGADDLFYGDGGSMGDWDEELAAQGVKPWDDDAGAVLGVLYGGE